MVLLTMTAAMVEALERIQDVEGASEENEEGRQDDVSTEASKTSDSTKDKMRRDMKTEAGEAEGSIHIAPGKVADLEKKEEKNDSSEPTLLSPRIGNPISHGQVVKLSQNMKARNLQPCHLEELLKGARVYIPPPPPKPEPVRHIPVGM